MKKLVFPKSLKHIGEYSFTLSSLEEEIIHADTEIGKGSFDSIEDWFLDSSDNTIKGIGKSLSEQYKEFLQTNTAPPENNEELPF